MVVLNILMIIALVTIPTGLLAVIVDSLLDKSQKRGR